MPRKRGLGMDRNAVSQEEKNADSPNKQARTPNTDGGR
jgi:hypothetical protein